MPTIILHQNAPAPQCGHVNVYTGLALAREQAATELAARDAAHTAARVKA